MLNLGLGLKLTQVQASAAPAGHTYGPNLISGSPSLSNADSGNPPTWDGTALSFADQGGNGAQTAFWSATIPAGVDFRVTATASGYGGNGKVSINVGSGGLAGVRFDVTANGAIDAICHSGSAPGQNISVGQPFNDDSCTVVISNPVVRQVLS